MIHTIVISALLISAINTQSILQPIHTYSCGLAQNVQTSVANCYNTPGCVLPQCCGIIAGNLSALQVSFTSPLSINSGTAITYLSGVTLTSNQNDPLIHITRSPLDVLPPGQVLGQDTNVCDHTLCPQTAGVQYTYTIPFAIVNSWVKSAVIIVFTA